MEGLLLVAGWLFVITHVDTLLVLVAFRSDPDYGLIEVLVGHYVGFGIGLTAAVVGAVVAADVLREWTFLLGLIPLTLGIWTLRRHRSTPAETRPAPPASPAGRIGVVTAAGVGLSGENIAAFVPFFVTLSEAALLAVVLGYFAGAGVVFLVAEALVRRGPSPTTPEWIERLLIPIVLIVVGGYVLATGWLLA